MRRLVLTSLVCFALLAGAASAGGSLPTGQIVFGMNHFCLTKDANGGSGKVPVDCGKGEIAVVNADGSGLRVLTHDNVTETSPRWSPNHEQIAFIRPRAHSSSRIWVMNADGSHQRALTPAGSRFQLYGEDVVPSLDWSPDGLQIVFASFPGRNGGVEQLFLANARTGHVTRLTYTAIGARDPVWSPDGRWIAYADDANSLRKSLWLVRPNGQGRHRIAREVDARSDAGLARQVGRRAGVARRGQRRRAAAEQQRRAGKYERPVAPSRPHGQAIRSRVL